MRFRALLADIAAAPFRGPIGSALLSAIGQGIDTQADPDGPRATASKMRQAMLAHMPTYQQDGSSLALLGADRQIIRGYAETDSAYATRLKSAFDAWAGAGGALTELQQLASYVFPVTPRVRLIHNTTISAATYSIWYTIPGSFGTDAGLAPYRTVVTPGNWNWDGDFTSWWRTWVILYLSAGPWVPRNTLGSGDTIGSGKTLGTTATPQQIADLRSIVAQWKARHSWCRWIILSNSASVFDPNQAAGSGGNPNGTWGPWSIYTAGLQQAVRNLNAFYCDGTPYQVVHGGSGSVIDTIGAGA